jgi:hypothetical protein
VPEIGTNGSETNPEGAFNVRSMATTEVDLHTGA